MNFFFKFKYIIIPKINNIIEVSKTVLWNGPAGYFENQNFAEGTISIAKKISNNTKNGFLISIVGGGDTISAIKNNGIDVNFTHLSTAGGAFLEYICLLYTSPSPRDRG